MGLFDRLKKAGQVITEPSQFSNEELVNQADMGRDPREQMQGEGFLKVLRAGAELLPDQEESSIPLDPNDPKSMRFDPSGMIGGVKNIAREMGPATEAVKAIQLANKEQQAGKLRDFLAGSNTLEAKNVAQVLEKLPKKPLGRTVIDTGQSSRPYFGRVTVR